MIRKQKVVFALAANVLGLGTVLFAAEFAVRWRSERGFRAAWHSFFRRATPFSDLGTGDWVTPDPDLGYRLNPSQPGVNSLGIRGPEPKREKTPGVRRIIVLGDSVAFPSDGFVGILAGRLKGSAEVINGSIPGYTTFQERRLLERDLSPLRPDLVILQYCVNDNHRFLHRFDANARMLMTEEAVRSLLPSDSSLASWLTRRSYLAARARLAWLGRRPHGDRWPWEYEPDVKVAWEDGSWELFAENLAAIRRSLEAEGRLAVVMAPYRPQFDPRVLNRGPSHVLKPQAKLAEICDAAGVPVLDLYPVFAQRGGLDLFYDNYHFNTLGHQVAADALIEFLHRAGLIKSSW